MDDPLEQYRRYASPNIGPYAASLIQIDSTKAMYLAIAIMAIAITFAALAFGFAMNAKEQAINTESRVRADMMRVEALVLREQNRIDRETRLQRLETDELKSAFMNAGLKTHLETDKP